VVLEVPEPDQEIGAEAHTLPADEHHEQVVAEDEHQHREQEEVQVGEEALEPPVIAVIVVHVADGVDVNQRADARDHQDHDRRQRVEQECELGVEGVRADPGIDVVDEEAPLRDGKLRQVEDLEERDPERSQRCAAGQQDDHPPRQVAASERQPDAADRGRDERQQRNPAERVVRVIRHLVTTSTRSDLRCSTYRGSGSG
jgi:hypothetical protein